MKYLPTSYIHAFHRFYCKIDTPSCNSKNKRFYVFYFKTHTDFYVICTDTWEINTTSQIECNLTTGYTKTNEYG